MAIIPFVWIFVSHVVCLLYNSVSKTSRSAVMHLLYGCNFLKAKSSVRAPLCSSFV